MTRLTIALPTYNRCDSLLRQLHALRSLGVFDDPELEIVVGNNASDDGTREVLDGFAAQVPGGLRVVHYVDHVGSAEENCGRLVHEARGDFVWLLSDDDVLWRPGYARLRALLTGSQAFDCLVFDDAEGADCEPLVDSSDHTIHGELSGVLQGVEPEGLVDFLGFVQRNGLTGYCALISRYVMRRELLDGAIELYASTSIIYSHIFGFMERLRDGRVMFVQDPLVWRRTSAADRRFARLARDQGWYFYRAWTRGLVDLAILFEARCSLASGWLGAVHERRNDGSTYMLTDEIVQQLCRQAAFALMLHDPAQLVPGGDQLLMGDYLRACGINPCNLCRLNALALDIRAFLEVSVAGGAAPSDLEEFARLWQGLELLRRRMLDGSAGDARLDAYRERFKKAYPGAYQTLLDLKNRYAALRLLSRMLMRALRRALS